MYLSLSIYDFQKKRIHSQNTKISERFGEIEINVCKSEKNCRMFIGKVLEEMEK